LQHEQAFANNDDDSRMRGSINKEQDIFVQNNVAAFLLGGIWRSPFGAKFKLRDRKKFMLIFFLQSFMIFRILNPFS